MATKLSQGADFGVLAKYCTVPYTDEDNVVELFDLPPECLPLDFIVYVTPAFTASDESSEVLDIGVRNVNGTDADYFCNDLDVSSIGLVDTSGALNMLRDMSDNDGSRPITIVAQLGHHYTAGAAKITLLYITKLHQHLH